MRKRLKVRNHPGLVRDSHSKAIINTDKQQYTNAVNQKILSKKTQEMSDKLEQDVDQLKAEMKEIKSMLTGIVSYLNGKQ